MDPMSAAIPYDRYSSLSPGERDGSIRLLRLMPNRDETAVIECQLFNYTLESGKGTHLYEALSYVWGNPDETVPIKIGEHCFMKVTKNLHAALLRLRNHSFERIVWVDAVCINQADDQEKAHQIQNMTKIYGQASRVIIWLGEGTDDSDQAFEGIRNAAEDEVTDSLEEANREPILKLLERPWFRRIWVLQEAAAARCILIMCGPAEMNGYTFCFGLGKLKLPYKADSGLQSLIRSVTYLLQGAIFRPRYAMTTPRLSLGELIDMYHTREATKRHDKIYALLGMSLEGPSAAGLLPNYQITWKETLQQLVEFILCKEITVKTWNEREIAVIKTKGCILGRVSLVESDSTRYDRQYVTVIFQNTSTQNTSTSLENKRKWGDRWVLRASAKSIQKGDIVCLVQGASKPSIIRPCKDHFAVIVIAVPFRRIPESLPSMEIYPRDFLLVWNWDESLPNLQGQAPGETSIGISTLVSEYSMTASNNLTSLYNMTLILQDVKEYEEAGKRLHEIIEGHEGPSTERHLYELAGMENSGMIYKEKELWEEAEELFLKIIQRRKELQGTDHPNTLKSIAYLASTYIDQQKMSKKELEMMEDLMGRIKDNLQIPEEEVVKVVELFGVDAMLPLLLDLKRSKVQITERVVKTAARSEKLMTLLLDRRDDIPITEKMVKALAEKTSGDNKVLTLLLSRRGDNIPITEEVVKAAAGNWNSGNEVMTLLLDRRGDSIPITEEVVEAAAGNWNSGNKVMTLLLDRRGDKIPITEEVVKEAVGNTGCGNEVMTLLLDRRRDNIPITEKVVKAAAGNRSSGNRVMTLLLDRRGDNIRITEEVVKAAAGNRSSGNRVMTLLPSRRGDDIPITEEVVEAAAGNQNSGKGVMALLLDRRGDNIPITEKVVKAAAGNWVCGNEVMTLLLDRRADNIPITAEVVKAAAGNEGNGYEVVSLLLKQCANKPHITSMLMNADLVKVAATCGQERVLDLLYNRYKFEDRTTWIRIAQFYNAAKNGRLNDVQRLLQEGVAPDLKNIRGVTPLWHAAAEGHAAVVKALLATGAVDVNSQDSICGRTPLFWASADGHTRVVQLLLDKGAHVHYKDIDSKTPISVARERGLR
ncbi:Heterokaryon incompatibility protein (HET) domain containing protein [Elaphomyces granulatus]